MRAFERSEKSQELSSCSIRLARTDPPRPLGVDIRSDTRDLAECDPPLERLLHVAATLRRLAHVDAFEHERVGEVRTLGSFEQPRPEVVVLALEVFSVVPEPVQHLPVDEHRWVEERRAEE